ncbi:Uncharacterised protein [Escherichia coli]|nr:Uncharacterised protein [Escherichia coli]
MHITQGVAGEEVNTAITDIIWIWRKVPKQR